MGGRNDDDTMRQLIKDYREKVRLLKIEKGLK
jgi:hypothetical protein